MPKPNMLGEMQPVERSRQTINDWPKIEIALVQAIGAGIGQQSDRILGTSFMSQGLFPQRKGGLRDALLFIAHAATP